MSCCHTCSTSPISLISTSGVGLQMQILCSAYTLKVDFSSYPNIGLWYSQYIIPNQGIPHSDPYIFIINLLFFFKQYANCFIMECFQLSLLDSVSRATVVAQASIVHPLSISSGFSETDAWIQAKFCGKLPICHISRHFFSVFKSFDFQNFMIFFCFVNMGPYGIVHVCHNVNTNTGRNIKTHTSRNY